MKIIGIIPARMGSTRFPGKPLAEICGTPMIEHVYNGTNESKLLDATYIATCDQEIMNYANSKNMPCVMTSNVHERCSDRTAEALLKIEKNLGEKVGVVVMIQGDEPMIFGGIIDNAITAINLNPEINVVNLMSTIRSPEEFEDPNIIKVVIDKCHNALYFSREPIPSRSKAPEKFLCYKQLGAITFRRDALLQFNQMAPTPLELVESVDMMRFLENGYKVKMVATDAEVFSVDTPQDLENVMSKMAKKIFSITRPQATEVIS